ncbi:hypothetical protein V8F06_007952, partial [Rhypophila decipiens]
GNDKPINYLCKPNAPRLRLFQSENEAFSDMVGLINDYEGVLSRHESLAAKLGAKLTSPRLLRAMESLFEGSIAATPLCQYGDARDSDPTWCAPSWLEIVDFAASHPRDFNLTSTPDGRRVCNFTMNNAHVEISEDDWRLIMSGALDRFRLVPPEPIEEDEVAELATIDILEKRLQTLIKEADAVARKARRLNYHLSGRKAALNSRRSSTTQSISSSHYQPVSQQRPPPPGSLNPAYDLQADLLQQFLAPSIFPQSGSSMTQPASISSGPLPIDVPRQSTAPSIITTSQTHILTPNSRRSPAYSAGSPTRREGTAPTSTAEESQAPYRSIIQTHVEELTKGDRITPPCDRCRRLNVICVKNLTSCQGCTKKHAKCTWKSVTDDEIDVLRGREPALADDRSERGDAGSSREGQNGESEGLYETNEAVATAAADTSLPTTEGDVDTEVETPEAAKVKDTPPSSASSSTRGQQPQQQARSISTGRHRHQ